jgi:peptidyl-prolyl cis-trans isomerase C
MTRTLRRCRPVEEFNASHILVETEEEAQALIDAVGRRRRFRQLAAEIPSGRPGPMAGSWAGSPRHDGARIRGSRVRPGGRRGFRPVQTQFGWHVILLDETRDQAPPALEEVRAELIEGLRRPAWMQHRTRLWARRNRTPELDIDPAVIANVDLLNE